MRRALLVVPLSTAIVAAWGCRDSTPPPTPHDVRYTFEWKLDGIQQREDGTWDTVNDLGYVIHVTQGYVISRSIEITECPRTPGSTASTSWSELAFTLLGPQPALGGHSMATPNPAAILTPRAESLIHTNTVEAGRVTLQPQQYCSAFYLIARANPDTADLPTDVDMLDASLYISGTYTQSGSNDSVRFQVRTAVANGTTTNFFEVGHYNEPHAAFRLDTGRSDGTVIVRRNLAGMFTGVDFAAMSEAKIARKILANLIDQIVIEVRTEGGSDGSR